MIGMPFEMSGEDQNPLDLIEDLADNKGRAFTRHDDNVLTLTIKGQVAIYDLELEWQEEFASVITSCWMNLPVREEHQAAAAQTLQNVNENLWLGHFDFSTEGYKPTFRHTLMLRLVPVTVSAEMLSDLIDLALAECDRFHTTFKMLSIGDIRMQDALNAAIFETIGEA